MRVWVTRREPRDGPLSSALRSVGLEAVLEPVLGQRALGDAAEVIARLGPADWLVLTSPFAVGVVAPEPARVPRVAVVGESSRRAAQARGFRVELVSSGRSAESLFKELRDRAHSGKVCYPRSSLTPEPQPWPGVELLSPVLYETRPCPFDRQVIERIDVVSVVSPSAVEAVGPVERPFASIGPATSAALRKIGAEPWVEAPEPSFESLAAAIADQADVSPHQRA